MERKKKYSKLVMVIILCAIVVIGIVVALIKGVGKINNSTNESVDKTLNEVRIKNKMEDINNVDDKNLDVIETHTVLSNELLSLLTEEQVKAIIDMADNSSYDEKILTLDTKYEIQKINIKDYCVNEIDRLKNTLAMSESISYDLDLGTIRYNFKLDKENETVIRQIEGLLGVYQRMEDNSKNWCVIVYANDSSYVISDENLTNEVLPKVNKATATDSNN